MYKQVYDEGYPKYMAFTDDEWEIFRDAIITTRGPITQVRFHLRWIVECIQQRTNVEAFFASAW